MFGCFVKRYYFENINQTFSEKGLMKYLIFFLPGVRMYTVKEKLPSCDLRDESHIERMMENNIKRAKIFTDISFYFF